MNKSEFRECFTCKHGRYKSDGKGRFEVHCNHPQNTRETNYKYAIECRGDSLNEYTHWEPKCDSDEPTIEAEPVKHGRWLPHKITASSICSLCRRVFADETPYCPNCGAKMGLKDGESE